MVALSPAAAALRAEVEAAVLAEVARVGVENFNRATVVHAFIANGGKRATLYRWVDDILYSGKPAEAAVLGVIAAAAARSARTDEPSREVAIEVSTKLPTIPKIEHIASAGTIPIINRLNTCLSAADQLMEHARLPDGKVKNAKLLLASSEHLRRCLETAAKITDTLMRAQKVEAFHQAIIDAIGEESPQTAERILGKISRLTTSWGKE